MLGNCVANILAKHLILISYREMQTTINRAYATIQYTGRVQRPVAAAAVRARGLPAQ